MNRIIVTLTLILLGFPGVSQANETSPKGEIKRLITYTKSSKDVFVSLENNGSICTYGYFIDKDTESQQSILSMLLAAYHSKTPIYISASETSRWTGSSNPVCEIYSVEYKR